ncbi:MAG TPA: DoxX family membrane protein [Verrucomicrobiae bacterium]|nr:DoxX family membrane protein [Verrucomicrobiae bacterium]
MRYLTIIARILMGLTFLVFGLNGFFHFIPQPKDAMPPGAMDFFGALMKTGYMIPLIFTTQTLVGALLLLNCFVPLALALIAPVIVNIILFHVYLAPSGIPMAIVVLALELFLAWAYRKSFAPMLAFRAKPD